MSIQKFDTMIISGSGMSSIPAVGILQNLTDNNAIDNIDTFVSYSMGSILSYLLCIECSPAEIISEIIQNLDIINFNINWSDMLIRKKNMVSYYNTVNKMLEDITIKKVGKYYTFKTLNEDTEINLIILSIDLTSGETIEMSHLNTPDMPILKAISMSSCIPFYFEESRYNGSKFLDGFLDSPVPYYIASKFCKRGIIAIHRNFDIAESRDVTYDSINPKALARIWEIIANKLYKKDLLIAMTLIDKPICNIIYEINSDYDMVITIKNILEMFSLGYRICVDKDIYNQKSLMPKIDGKQMLQHKDFTPEYLHTLKK